MRRILSILLFGLLLYNMIGYSVVYLSDDLRSVSDDAKNLIEQSSGSSDIVIKVPVAVPYQSSWDAPEPAEGEIEHEGQFYQMKSKQLINDTLYVHCEMDQNARDHFSELVSRINEQVAGHHNSQNDGHSHVLKNFLKEYMTPGSRHVFYVLEWTPVQNKTFEELQLSSALLDFQIPSPPPDLA